MTRTTRAVIAWTAVAAVLLGLAWALVAAGRARTVIVLNPLEEAVTVRFDAVEVKVPGGGRTTADVPTGAVQVEVQGAGGRVLDRHRLYVSVSEKGQAIYSILGAAPLYRVNVIYTAEHAPRTPRGDGPNGLQLLVGERFLLANADYVLEKPPEQIEMPEHSTQTVKTLVDLAPGGWQRALGFAPDTPGGLAVADTLARRLHRALPAEWYPTGLSLATTILLQGPEAEAALAEEAVSVAPDSGDVHRAYLHAMRQAGRLEALRARYRARAAESPASPLATAMLLRVLPRDAAEPAARAALAAFPEHREVLLAAGHALLGTGHPADAAAVFARVPLTDAHHNGFVEWQVQSLLAAGRAREAAAAALAAARVEDADAESVALYARVARLPGAHPAEEPGELLKRWADQREGAAAWVQAQLGELEAGSSAAREVTPAEAAVLRVTAAASRNPTEALDLCRKARELSLTHLPEEVGYLLALEAYRTGERDLYRRLRLHVVLSDAEVAAWIDRGVEPEEAWRLDPGARAALALARERRLRASGLPVPPALAAEARGDPLSGPAALAAARWPAPARAAPPVQLILEQPLETP